MSLGLLFEMRSAIAGAYLAILKTEIRTSKIRSGIPCLNPD